MHLLVKLFYDIGMDSDGVMPLQEKRSLMM